MASETGTKKCSKAVPVFFFLAGAITALVGAGEGGGGLMFIALIAYVFCKMVDSANEVPASATPVTTSDAQWPDPEKKARKMFPLNTEFGETPSGADRVFFGVRAEYQASPSRFMAEDRKQL